MLAQNKENVVLQAPQAGKVNPKTPGPSRLTAKTPFRIPLNDENGTGTVMLKAGKKSLFAGKDPALFVTPVGPRRKALAGKTTNAKAKNQPPPGDDGGAGKKLDFNVNRQVENLNEEVKLTRHEEEDVPEIEYMAPVPSEIPFVPEGFEEPDYENLRRTYMRNCHRTYLSGFDEDGKTELQRQLEESYRQLGADLDTETEKLLDEINGTVKPKAPAEASVPRSGALAVTNTRGPVDDRTVRPRDTKRSTSSATIRQKITSTSRPTSRPDSRSSVRPTSGHPSSSTATGPTSASLRRVNSIDSKKAAELLARPNSSASVRGPESKLKAHTRSASTSMPPPKKPLSVSKKQQSALKPSNTQTRSRSYSNTTIGYRTGREIKDKVKREVAKTKFESALDAIERIQREDEERFGPLDEINYALPSALSVENAEEDSDDSVVVDFPSPLMDDEDGFFMTMPGEA